LFCFNCLCSRHLDSPRGKRDSLGYFLNLNTEFLFGGVLLGLSVPGNIVWETKHRPIGIRKQVQKKNVIFFFFYWSVVDYIILLVSGVQQSDSHTHTHIHTHIYSRLFSIIGFYEILNIVPCESLLLIYYMDSSLYLFNPGLLMYPSPQSFPFW